MAEEKRRLQTRPPVLAKSDVGHPMRKRVFSSFSLFLVAALSVSAVVFTSACNKASETGSVSSCVAGDAESSLPDSSFSHASASSSPYTAVSPQTSEASAQPGELTMNDMKIGKLFIGESMDNTQKDFGEPKVKTIVHGNGSPQWEYPDLGLTIWGFPVWNIRSYKNIGNTPRGIHIGSTEQEVRKAYPTAKEVGPDNATSNSNNFNDSTQSDFTLQACSPEINSHHGSQFSIAFFIFKGKVIGFNLYEDLVAKAQLESTQNAE